MFVLLLVPFDATPHTHLKISSENLRFSPSSDWNNSTQMSSCPLYMYPYENKSLQNIDGEEWKEINGLNGYYAVSNFGRVKRIKASPERGKPIKIMAQSHPDRYLTLHLYVVNKSHYYLTHRVVALHFIENPNNFPDVNHKDGVKLNNHVSNLEWCTRGHNIRHSYRTGLQVAKRGEESGVSKLKDKDVIFIRTNRDLYSVEYFCKMYSISPNTVCHIIANFTWRHIKVHQKY